MKAQRKITFKVINSNNEVTTLTVNSKREFVLAAALVKKNGGQIIKASISVSDTIVIGYTNIIKAA